VKIIEIWGSENDPKRDFCYIVVSTIFGPSGPPPDPPKSDFFDPPIGAKEQPICGDWVFQEGQLWGSILGVEKGGAFAKSAENSKNL
jgi:hypothetical protein